MSQENVDSLRLAFDAVNRRDRAAWLGLCDPEIEDVPPRGWPESVEWFGERTEALKAAGLEE